MINTDVGKLCLFFFLFCFQLTNWASVGWIRFCLNFDDLKSRLINVSMGNSLGSRLRGVLESRLRAMLTSI